MQKRITSMFVPYCFKNNNLYIYLQKRSSNSRNPNSLGAFGGGLENNENNEEALIREMDEELEYKPINYSLLGVIEDDYSISNYYIEEVKEIFEENIKINEGKGGEWYKAKEVIERNDISLNTKNVVKMMINKLQKYRKFYITGVSGTGKTTMTKELNQRGILAIDQDSKEFGLCSWKHNETMQDARFEYGIGNEFLESNDWYCDIEKLKKILDDNKEISFVCGVSANQNEYLDIFDKVFLLQCSPEELVKRINKREDHQFGKHQSEKDHILNYYKDFEEDLIKKGAIPINAEGSVDSVVNAIISNI